jgi:hypothetical protein
MALDAPVTMAMWGEYISGTGQGSVNVYLQNDSTEAIIGRVIIVITEDSLFYPAPNGVMWHSHVPRVYIPDYNGTMVYIPPSDHEIVTEQFTLDPHWNDDFCTILAWIQNDSMYVDSTKEIWQGAMKKVTELGIEEIHTAEIEKRSAVHPNPCKDRVDFTISMAAGFDYCLKIYDILGRQIITLQGITSGEKTVVEWTLRGQDNNRVGAGVYLYELSCESTRESGKIIVR